MRYRFLGLVLVCAGAVVWMACSGDDKTDATSIGAEGQDCLPGAQCIAGFICVGGKCITSNGGPSGDGGVLFVGNPKATPSDCEDIGQAEQALCPTQTDGGDVLCTDQQASCCAGIGCMSGNDSCTAPQGKFACFSTAGCNATSNGHCCLTVQPGAGTACQPTSVSPGAGSVCTGGADTACDPQFDIELCKDDNDCPQDAPCTKTVLNLTGADGTPYVKTIGYCALPAVVPEAGTPDAGTTPPKPDAGDGG